MGFWHTGYIEFHEPVGLEGEWRSRPVRLPCPQCGQEFGSEDELRKHRFEAHLLRRPALFLDGQELGTLPVRITRPVTPKQIKIEWAEQAVLNGREVAVSRLGHELAALCDDVCRIVLRKRGVEAQFVLEIRIASEADLGGVEEEFKRMVAGRRLDGRAIEEFISGASRFRSAMGYCDGICAYLYGLLAKECADGISLPHAAYAAKYAKATEELKAYDRNLARIICALIEFHFNHFRDAERLCPGSRLGRVAGRYAAWIESRAKVPAASTGCEEDPVEVERLVTDWETECILGWASRPLPTLAERVGEIDLFLKRELADFDRVKLHMLLGEIFASIGNVKLALEHARGLRNLPTVERWAEVLIHDFVGSK